MQDEAVLVPAGGLGLHSIEGSGTPLHAADAWRGCVAWRGSCVAWLREGGTYANTILARENLHGASAPQSRLSMDAWTDAHPFVRQVPRSVLPLRRSVLPLG